MVLFLIPGSLWSRENGLDAAPRKIRGDLLKEMKSVTTFTI